MYVLSDAMNNIFSNALRQKKITKIDAFASISEVLITQVSVTNMERLA